MGRFFVLKISLFRRFKAGIEPVVEALKQRLHFVQTMSVFEYHLIQRLEIFLQMHQGKFEIGDSRGIFVFGVHQRFSDRLFDERPNRISSKSQQSRSHNI